MFILTILQHSCQDLNDTEKSTSQEKETLNLTYDLNIDEYEVEDMLIQKKPATTNPVIKQPINKVDLEFEVV